MKPSQFGILAGFLAAVSLVLLLAGRPVEVPAPPPEPVQPAPRVTATGEALVWVQPDIAYLTFRIRVQGATAAQAEALLNASIASVSDALVPAHVPGDALRVVRREVHQLERGLGRTAPPFEAEAALEVQLAPTQVLQVVPVVFAAGATDYDGAVYGLQDSAKVQQEAIAAALAQARSRAATVAGVRPDRLGESPDLEVQVSVGEATAQEAILIRARVRATFTY